MNLKICRYGSTLGISNGKTNIILENGKIIEEEKLENCVDLPFLINDQFLVFGKDLLIPLIFKDEKTILSRILFIVLGKTNHELFYYKNTSIFIDEKLLDIKFDKLHRSYSKICGNYGSTKLVYCITNYSISILSPCKKEGEEALISLKKFISLLSEINNSI
ncbi:hypothetical protein [Acidianus manzaensis]|uniref:Uncharacterized protein n=1 Tax=Acidianus manzaensis TaxID=282676 RepID=A0A1W6JZQ9_9CREN|nr:hypothetical protein [Acidianus manzaensis]ARM75700.1 hypothetical protein B6F84_06370 [Acidianus manzaensis]